MVGSKEQVGLHQPENTALSPLKSREVDGPISNEVRSWLHQVESLQQNQQVVINDQNGSPVLQQSTITTQKPKTLPTTRSGFVKGFKLAVNSAGRWLSVFVFRMIKMKKGNITFKADDV